MSGELLINVLKEPFHFLQFIFVPAHIHKLLTVLDELLYYVSLCAVGLTDTSSPNNEVE